ncbi:MAG: hypothetical protein K2Y37_01460 [Pirellulales bacterium]|nr:hypothetical protein [Pirellulales bacterium]
MAVALLAMAVRGAAVWRLADNLARDPDGYRVVARSLVDHGDLLRDGQPTAWRPPLYPLLLAKLLWISDWAGPEQAERAFVVSVGVTQVICGVATALLVLYLGWRLGLGRWSLLAAVLVICDPLLVYQSAQVMTETLATLLAVGAWSILVAEQRPHLRAVAAGILLGMAVMCRPTFLLWGFLIMAWSAGYGWRTRQLLQPALAIAAFALALAPWAARNWRELGRPIVTTTHGGYTLLLANNTRFYGWLREGAWGTIWDSREFVDDWLARKRAAGIDNEVDEDRLARQLAIDTMRDDPVGFVRATAVRLGRFWSLAPHASAHGSPLDSASTRWLIATWYLAEFALAVVGLTVAANSPRRASWLAGVLLVVALSVVHAVYWSDLRMRAPVMPVVALLAAAGASRLRGAQHPQR